MQKTNIQLGKTILISGIAVVISYLINFFLTSYITESVGIEAYGFVSIARTFVNYATIVTLALTAFIVRHISVSYLAGEFNESRSYYSSSIAACSVISAIILVFFIVIVFFLEYLINIPENLVLAVKILFIVVVINFCVTTISTPFSAAAYIKNRLDIAGIIKIISYLFDAGVMILMFMNLTPEVWYVGIGSLCASSVVMIGNVIMTKRLTPELKFRLNSVSLKKIKTMTGQGVWNSLNQLGNELNSGLDLLVSNWFLSDIATGQISVVKTIGTMFSTLSATVWQPCQPQLIKAYTSQKIEDFLREVKKSMKVCGFFTAIAFAGFIALGQLYFKLWLPSQDSGYLYILAMVAIANQITEGLLKPVYYINTLTIKNKIPCIITIVSGVLNVVSMIILLNYTVLGAFVVVGTTSAIMFLINLLFNPIYAAKCLKIKMSFFYRIIIRHFLATGILICVFLLIALIPVPENWLGLFISAMIMVIVGTPIYILATNNQQELKEFLLKIKNKLSNRK